MLTFSKKNYPFDFQESREWLETNASGSYASSTLSECHSRKYHGLLVAALTEPYGKFVLLSKFEEHLQDGATVYPLSSHRYQGFLANEGFANFERFQLDLMPQWHYQCGTVQLSKTLLFLAKSNTVLIKYRVTGLAEALTLSLKPLLAYRSYHALAQANHHIRGDATLTDQGVSFSPYDGMPTLHLVTDSAVQFSAQADWYYHFEYAQEKARGYDYLEDLFAPGILNITIGANQAVIVACSTDIHRPEDLSTLWQQEISRRITKQLNLQACSKDQEESLSLLLKSRAARQVLVQEATEEWSVEAGYHWFSQWGRDAMLSLPGLTLYSGDEALCLAILKHFAKHESQGMIPNRIAPLAGEQDEYDSIDASLWFCWAVQQYYMKTRDLAAIEKALWPTLKNIIHFYQAGTRFGIHQAANGLLYGGNATVKLTWMDVMIDGVPITPRSGAAVEINALWYNACCFVHELAKALKDPLAKSLKANISLIKISFCDIFWHDEAQCLYDFVNDQEANAQIRPNQIIAASLPYCPLKAPMALAVIKVVEQHLLTPYGLRTLSPTDKHYQGLYEGNQTVRDNAYHHGTVWPWLLGPLTDALLKFTSKKQAQKMLQPCLIALKQHVLHDAGIACVSEIFDGDAPHQPRGCIQQAWSIAELIRVLDLLK